MKKIFVMAAFAGISLASFGQADLMKMPKSIKKEKLMEKAKDMTSAQKAAQNAKNLGSKLGLSADQTGSVEKINLEYFQNLEQVKSTYTLAQKKEAKAAINELRTKREGSISQILTEGQLATWNKMKTQAREKIKGKLRGLGKGKKADQSNLDQPASNDDPDSAE